MKEKNKLLETLFSDDVINLNLDISVSEDKSTITVIEPDINLIIQQIKEKIDEKYFKDTFDIDLDTEFTKQEIKNFVKQQIDKFMMNLNKENINEFIENFK